MVIESRPSDDLRRAGDRPPCRIEEQGGAPVLGGGCEGTAHAHTRQRSYAHEACPGWWAEVGEPDHAPGFRCDCSCHALAHGWAGWDKWLRR